VVLEAPPDTENNHGPRSRWTRAVPLTSGAEEISRRCAAVRDAAGPEPAGSEPRVRETATGSPSARRREPLSARSGAPAERPARVARAMR